MGVKMKVRFLVLLFAIFVNAEITNETEFLRAINTPSPFNKCGSYGEQGKSAVFENCIRSYFPSCYISTGNMRLFQMMSCAQKTDAVNVSQKDIQRQKQIEEWKEKHK